MMVGYNEEIKRYRLLDLKTPEEQLWKGMSLNLSSQQLKMK